MPEPTFEDAKAALRALMDHTEAAILARRPEADGFCYSFEQCCTPGRPFMVVFFDCSEGEMQNMIALRGYNDEYMTFTSQLMRAPLSEGDDESLRQLLLLGGVCGFWEIDGIMPLSGIPHNEWRPIDYFGRYRPSTVAPLQLMLALEGEALSEKWADRTRWIENGWHAYQAHHATVRAKMEAAELAMQMPPLESWDAEPDYLG
jgi:hypothetical protein